MRCRTGWGWTAVTIGLIVSLQANAAPPLPRVPPGFTIEVAAEAPVVERPVMACFDEKGRLFVVDSAGVNEPFEKLLKNPPHRIVVIEDTDGDGRFDKRTVFADQLVMPQGVLPHNGAVYTASPPSVWKLEDTDDDGVCDKRTAIVSEFGSNGNAADIHGPFLGPDGWLYLCDGRHGHKVRREDGTIDQGLAGGIFRFRTDGTGFERVCGGGFDNPVEIVFTPAGEMLGTVNILHGNPRQDSLMHWVEGGVYPRTDQEQCIAEFKRTGDLLPEVKSFGHVAVSGLVHYRSSAFGPEYQNNLFITFFNRHKLVRTIIERNGATFSAREEDFLVSEEKDFHPTDVFEDADGSLLVIDTGGWFRIGCPVSEISKPDVLGKIYRIRKTGGQESVSVTAKAIFEAEARAQLWELARDSTGRSTEILSDILRSKELDSRIIAARSLGMSSGNPGTSPAIVERLARAVVADLPPMRREAATTLGRICASANVPPDCRSKAVSALFESIRAGVSDRVLEHALIYAAIRIDSREHVLPFLADANPQVRRAALITLDQLDHGDLTRELVTPLLDTDDPALRQAALAVIGSRKGWATEILTLLRTWLHDPTPTDEQLSLLRGVLLAQSGDLEVQTLIGDSLQDLKIAAATRLVLWEALDRSPQTEFPTPWLRAVRASLERGSSSELKQLVSLIQSRGLSDFDDVLVRIAADNDQPAETRIAALTAAAPRRRSFDEPSFLLLVANLKPDLPPLTQLAAARGLAEAPLSLKQLMKLAEMFSKAGPLTTPVLIRAFAKNDEASVGLKFIAALSEGTTAESLSVEELAGILRKYPPQVQNQAKPLLARLGGSSLEEQRARLTELSRQVDPPGDAAHGKAVFFGKKAACASCHSVGAEGGRVGPDLTKIAASRSTVDLLEAIVFPSATFAREFRPYVIATQQGKVYTGVIGRQTADAIHLRTADLAEIRIPRGDIEEMRESNTSIMPKGLDTSLTPDELRDLMSYLQTLK